MEKVKKIVPGCLLALALAVAAKGLEYLEGLCGVHLIGASVIALFLGMLVHRFYKPSPTTAPEASTARRVILQLKSRSRAGP